MIKLHNRNISEFEAKKPAKHYLIDRGQEKFVFLKNSEVKKYHDSVLISAASLGLLCSGKSEK